MKKIIAIFSLLVFFTLSSCSSSNTNGPFEIKTGTELTYAVDAGGMQYDFVVTITSVSDGISFDWKMTAPVNSSGKVSISSGALKNAVKYNNYFRNNTTLKLTDESSVFLSEANAANIKDKTQMDVGDGMFSYSLNPGMSFDMEVPVNGNIKQIPVSVLYCSDKEYQINFTQVGKYYLITGMYIGFYLELKSVKS
jgi:hypothetical protein